MKKYHYDYKKFTENYSELLKTTEHNQTIITNKEQAGAELKQFTEDYSEL